MIPPGFWLIPPFDGLGSVEQAAITAAHGDATVGPWTDVFKDHTWVAVLVDGRALISRGGVVERVVGFGTVLDLQDPGAGNEASFHTLEACTLIWVPRSVVDAQIPASKRLAPAQEQVRDERQDLADLVDRQTWLWPDTPSLPATPYAGELDYAMLVIEGMPPTWSLPADTTPISNRVVAVIGVHTAGSSGTAVLPAGTTHGQAWLWVPVQQGTTLRYHVVEGWTDHLTVLHLMRELYGLQLTEGRVFDGASLGARLLAFAQTLRWRCEIVPGALTAMTALAGDTGIPWDAVDQAWPMSFGFAKAAFGVGPAFDRACVADFSLAYTTIEDLTATHTSLDGVTMAGGAVVSAYRVQSQFVLQLPKARKDRWRDRVRAWVVG